MAKPLGRLEPNIARRFDVDARYLCLILMVVALSSCGALQPRGSANEGPAWESFAALVPVTEWNQSIEVMIPEPPRYTFSAYVVHVLVMNRSDKDLWFPPGYGGIALVYSREEDAWSEVDNSMTYQGAGETLVPRLAPDSNWAAQVTIIPDISSASYGDILRIVVVGEVVTGDAASDKSVGAYTDIELSR